MEDFPLLSLRSFGWKYWLPAAVGDAVVIIPIDSDRFRAIVLDSRHLDESVAAGFSPSSSREDSWLRFR